MPYSFFYLLFSSRGFRNSTFEVLLFWMRRWFGATPAILASPRNFPATWCCRRPPKSHIACPDVSPCRCYESKEILTGCDASVRNARIWSGERSPSGTVRPRRLRSCVNAVARSWSLDTTSADMPIGVAPVPAAAAASAWQIYSYFNG